MYFQKFPAMYYDFTGPDGEVVSKIVTDITLNVRARKALVQAAVLYDTYDIKDGETPEVVASKFYGVSLYHWIIMLLNERYNVVTDWPMPSSAIEPYAVKKYGANHLYDIHHWVNPKGFEVSSTTLYATPVTNLDHEININDKKRRIKIVSPDVLQQLLKQLRDYI